MFVHERGPMSRKNGCVGMREVVFLAMAGFVVVVAAGCKKQPTPERPPALVTVADAQGNIEAALAAAKKGKVA